MKKEKPTKNKRPIGLFHWKIGLIFGLILVILTLFSYIAFLAFFDQKIYPGVKIAGQDLGGYKPVRAKAKLQADFEAKVAKPLTFSYQEQTYHLDLSLSEPELDLEQKVQMAYTIGRSGQPLEDGKNQILALTYGINLTPELSFKKRIFLTSQLNRLNSSLRKDPQEAKIVLADSITITPSVSGQELDEQTLLKGVKDYLRLIGEPPQTIPLKPISPKLSSEEALVYKSALEKTKVSPITFSYASESAVLDQKALYNMMDFDQSEASPTASHYLIDKGKLALFLKTLTDKINQETRDARFVFNTNTGKVEAFQTAQEGRSVDIDKAADSLNQALLTESVGQEIKIPLIVNITQPKITASNDANNLGVKELLGSGVSYFTGSISNRIYNLTLASSRINGILIAPGETFSFNDALGEVASATGFKPAYVIKSGRTVLDDGGGVCQVSTTLFRAVLNAGLPILERTAHAYRVGYYEQGGYAPGFDATVFAPSVDFKFKNDTLAHLLIQAYVKNYTLYFDLYGTSDGRATTISSPRITNQAPPPPEIRQDDPTLAVGETKQVEWPAWGANVAFDRIVERDGETIIKETWRSSFRPWAAVYLVGTKQ